MLTAINAHIPTHAENYGNVPLHRHDKRRSHAAQNPCPARRRHAGQAGRLRRGYVGVCINDPGKCSGYNRPEPYIIETRRKPHDHP